MTMPSPFIVGIGGTINPGSATERALRLALDAAEAQGARVRLFDGPTLAMLPHYRPGAEHGQPCGDYVDAIRAADGVIIASPGYHGSISGVVKNALDLLEETARDDRPYLADMPVGLIATAYGWQATGSTLAALRSIVHSLRGWPTPLGATVKAMPGLFGPEGCTDPVTCNQLELVGRQVVEFAKLRHRLPFAAETGEDAAR